jgi:hypothetical protein
MPKIKGKVLGKVRELSITQEQRVRLLDYTTGQGGRQDLCQRVHDSVVTKDGKLVARVYDTDMVRIGELIARADTGGWQDLFREIMDANK